MARKTADSIEKSLLNNSYTKADSISELPANELAALPQEQLKVYNALRRFESKQNAGFVDIEVVKELFDYYNPDGLRRSPDGKPLSTADNLVKVEQRDFIQKFLEEE